jgi:hypothetical protein
MRKSGNLPWMYSIIWPPRPESVVIVSFDNKPHESKQCKRKKVNNESLTGSVVRLSSMLWASRTDCQDARRVVKDGGRWSLKCSWSD